MNRSFFPQKPNVTPIIYAYSDSRYPNTYKVGYTTRSIEERMKEHYPTIVPNQSWKVEWTASALRNDGTTFMDHEIHKYLNKHIEVLFEEEKDGIWSGYTKNYIKVYYRSNENLENKIISVIPVKKSNQTLIAK